MLVRKVGLKGKRKLADCWAEEVCVVQGRPSLGTPVYDVKPESSRGRSHILHRNMLMPITSVPPRAKYLEEQEQQDSVEPAQLDEEEPCPGVESESDEESEVAVGLGLGYRLNVVWPAMSHELHSCLELRVLACLLTNLWDDTGFISITASA